MTDDLPLTLQQKRDINHHANYWMPHADWPLPNVWLGTSVENQETADERIPHLLNVPAAVRWLSCEPLLGPVDLRFDDCWIEDDHYELSERIHWVVVGGESGRKARPMHPDWARSLRDQCVEAGVPFYFKQVGAWGHRSNPPIGVTQSAEWVRFGKKKAGRLLDGVEWNEYPE